MELRPAGLFVIKNIAILLRETELNSTDTRTRESEESQYHRRSILLSSPIASLYDDSLLYLSLYREHKWDVAPKTDGSNATSDRDVMA